jgi:short-subunit dehydrogenase
MSIVINTPSGNIGGTLAQILVDAGEPVTLISRSPAKVSALAAQFTREVLGPALSR